MSARMIGTGKPAASEYRDKAEEKAAKAFEPVLTDAYLSM